MVNLNLDRHELAAPGQAGGKEGSREEEVDERIMEQGDSEGEGEPEQLPPVDTSNVCLICKKQEAYIEFAAWPCGCPSMCRSCAQKLCTGGKCKVCHEMFPEIKRCRLGGSSSTNT